VSQHREELILAAICRFRLRTRPLFAAKSDAQGLFTLLQQLTGLCKRGCDFFYFRDTAYLFGTRSRTAGFKRLYGTRECGYRTRDTATDNNRKPDSETCA
jgi:hypothetical protein